MISIIKSPYEVSLSKNPIIWEVETNNLFETIGVKPKLILSLTEGWMNVGETLRFSFINPLNSEPIVVQYHGALIDDEDWKLNADPTVATIFMHYYLNKFKSNKYLSAWYNITGDYANGLITFEAKQELKELVLKFETTNTTVFNVDRMDADAIISEDRHGYRMSAQIFFENEYKSGNFNLITDGVLVVDNEQKSIIDVSNSLDSAIENLLDEKVLPWENQKFYKLPNLYRYYIVFTEQWNSQNNVITRQSPIKLVHWGGVSFEDENTSDIWNLTNQTSNYLTWTRSSKILFSNQEDWIAWMNFGALKNCTIKLKIKCSTSTIIQNIGSITLDSFESVAWNVGVRANSILAAIPIGETLRYWEFFIDGESVSRRYHLKRGCEQNKTIAFLNAFGVWETIGFKDEFIESCQVTSNIASRSMSYNNSGILAKNYVFDSKIGNAYKANTGALKQEDAKRLQCFLSSHLTFLFESSRWIPTIIDSGENDISMLNEFLSNISFSMVKANESKKKSFFEIQPDVTVVYDFGVHHFDIIKNGLEIVTYGNLQLFRLTAGGVETLQNTYTWNGENWYSSTTFRTPGRFIIKVTLTDVSGKVYNIKKFFVLKKEELEFSYDGNGTLTFGIWCDDGERVVVDFGDGFSIGEPANDIPPYRTYTRTYTGTPTARKVRIKKTSFKKLTKFTVNKDIGHFDFSQLPALTFLSISNGYGDDYNFESLQNLKNIRFLNTPLRSLNLGFVRNLTEVIISDANMTANSINDLIEKFWLYRKLYADTPVVTLENLGVPVPSKAMSIINGTGSYVGEGLVSNYNWTFNIS